jgi:DNA processing protein
LIDRDELAAWLRLLETPQVGRTSARQLLAAFGSAPAVLAASTAARREVVGPIQATALAAPPESFDALLATTLAWLAHGAEAACDVIVLGDPRYPQALLESADPPLLLYVQGRCELLAAESLAVVGSRRPTPQGQHNARTLAAQLSQAGFTIVSGLALGVDGAAHEGGLAGPGSTIAVVGTGLDRVYPSRHLKLAHHIATQGLIVSEYSLGTPPLAAHFPARNRIIAGLSRGTLVIEAALRSGSLITARLAAEAGREVFAIPGSIHSPQSQGCHALIKQGAKLVEVVGDVLEELQRPSVSGAAPAPPTPPAPGGDIVQPTDPLLTALGFDPVTLDELSARTGWPAAELNLHLLELELDGRVARLPGQFFQRIAHG